VKYQCEFYLDEHRSWHIRIDGVPMWLANRMMNWDYRSQKPHGYGGGDEIPDELYTCVLELISEHIPEHKEVE
jgi:hypothetical protein